MRFRVVDFFHIILSLSVIMLLAVIRLKLPNKTHVINAKPLELKRESVTLDDGDFTYHLNFSQFQEEFPYLQSYYCSLIYTPRLENGGASPLLLLAIKSHPASVSRRAALRKTWAKPVEVMDYRVRPVFLMALSDQDKHMEIVKVEQKEYGDILLWNFTEGHHNLSLKERCFLEWLHYNPLQPDFIFKDIMRFRVVDFFHIILSLSVIMLLAVIRLKLPNKTHVINAKPLELKRESVTLDDGDFTYHLNFSQFQEEFPYLQSYYCSLIYTPRLENGGASPLLLLAIKSHPASVSRRAALRKTWAKPVEVMDYRVRPVFLMALSDQDKHMEIVKVEQKEYGDILLWNFTEGHHNLSLKERCFLEWLHYNPLQPDFIFKGDDDVFVNPAALVHYIKVYSSPTTLHGALQRHSIVLRFSKYQVSKNLFPNAKYPYFLSGGGFLFPGASVPLLYRASLKLPVFPLDDVYLGFLSLAANLTLHHDSRFHVFGLNFSPCNFQQAFVVHRIDPDSLLKIWSQVHEAKCDSTEPNTE